MPLHRIKHTFTTGEVSPLLNSRADFDQFKNGSKVLFNMFCATQGPAIRRPGFQFLYDLSSLTVPHIERRESDWRRVQDDYGEDGPNDPGEGNFAYSLTPGSIYLAINKTDEHGADRTDDLLTIGEGDRVIIDQNDNEDRYVVLEIGPFRLEQTDFVWWSLSGMPSLGPDGHPTLDSSCQIILEAESDALMTPTAPFRLVPFIYDEDTSYMLVFCRVDPDEDTMPMGGMLMFIVYDEGLIIDDEGDPIYLSAINSAENPQLPNGGYWQIEDFDYAQSGDELYIAQGSKAPCAIVREGHDDWYLIEYEFQNEPSEWNAPANWPQRVTFHQQRLAYACSRWHRQTVWLSKAGDYHSFSTEPELNDDDAITFVLASGTQDKIQWLTSSKALNIGTTSSEWTVTGATQLALTPTNLLAQRQTNNGSEAVKPILVGVTTLFLERHGRKVNEFRYDYTYDSYITNDMSILATHLTDFFSIHNWAYQQTPDSIVWCVLENGNLISLTYQRMHKVVGWHRHEVSGEVKDIGSIPGRDREDEIYIVVKRWGNYYLEKLGVQFTSEEAKDGRFLDSYIVYDGDPTDIVIGADHLEGQEVHILADGTVLPPQTVVNGQIVFNDEFSTIVLGLPYISEVRPHVADVILKDGTMLGRTQKITNIEIDFYKTLGVYIGRNDQDDGEFEEEFPFRRPADRMDEQVPLFSGIYHIDFMEGFDRRVEYFIRQKQPLPLTVRGVTDIIEVYE